MDTVIQTARQLGRAIQADDRFIALKLAQDQNDKDAQLQEMIADFNQKRALLNSEIQKADRDQDAIQAMDRELKEVYGRIFENERMIAFNRARDELQELIQFVNQILVGSADGRNPDLIEYEASCGGDCGGCSGCN